ncbi:MAG TPA: hypothetical protein VKP65_07655 [Rhodothermales bacterium]|nr:hypothetical protein [Rhodothermales bacterium]
MPSLRFYILRLGVFALFFLSACDTTDVQEAPLRTNLQAPTLLQTHSTQTLPSNVAFEWRPVEEATRYEVELSRDASGKTPLLLPTVAPSYHLTLDAAGEYAWRARAFDARGRAGYWSKHHRLTVLPR